MTKLIPGLVLAASAIAASSGNAFAYEGDHSWRHIERDRQELREDASKVREEQDELRDAQRRLHRAYEYGSGRDVARAEAQVRHERAELNEARRDYSDQRADLVHDTDGHGWHHHRHHWWRWW